jgi:2-(1,2-epoxy-1,2-dihydrophenyl)acetyl-CoA isomerase
VSRPPEAGRSPVEAPTVPVRVQVDGGVTTVVLDRPAAMNSLDTATKVALRDILARVAEDPAVRCVVLTGTGRAFCVGQDLNEHVAGLRSEVPASLAATVEEHFNPIVTSLLTMAKPVVAAVNGVAAGAGVSLALACDYRLLADSAGYNLAFAGIGLSCDTGSSWTLPRLVGRAKALELLYEPRTITADEALALGLATRVVPASALPEEAAALAQRLAAGPTQAYGAIRRAVTESATSDLPTSLAFEAAMMALTGATEDHRDAVEAFLAKRPPEFHGR